MPQVCEDIRPRAGFAEPPMVASGRGAAERILHGAAAGSAMDSCGRDVCSRCGGRRVAGRHPYGLTIAEAEAKDAAARDAQAEREKNRRAERERRERIREAEEAADAGEHRSGSNIRRQYTAKDKVAILEVFDAINADTSILRKVEAFEADPRAKGTPYTTVRAHWTKPEQRATIYAAAGKEHAGSLLRIDKTSRKVGMFDAMEKDMYYSSRTCVSRRGARVAARCRRVG
eukprot:6871943-Prymnesium_polylepis.1